MKTLTKRMLRLLSAAMCGAAVLVSSAGAGADRSVPCVDEEQPVGRGWQSSREAYDGPVLDAAWFAKRRVVVYLVPAGGLPTVRGPAASVIGSHWTAGDWSLKHVFVSSVPSKPIFLAGRRIGLYDLAQAVTKAAGQGDEFVASNEEYVRQNVFFVHDPEGTAWTELLGVPAGERQSTAVVLLDGGRVVKSITLEPVSYATASEAEREEAHLQLAAEVRESLPARP
jgi:hypothetical protein